MTPVDRSSGGSGSSSRGGQPLQTMVFACTGEYWTVGYGKATFALKDVKGLSYVQRLLQHPGKEFHALDLLNGPVAVIPESNVEASARAEGTDSVGGLGDAGEMVDAQAKLEYKRRLVELNEQLENLRLRGDHQRAEQVESEVVFLRRELARAFGLGGRDRRAGSTAERARLNVTRAIRAALQKISERDATFGAVLDRSIRTGSFCSYLPNSSAALRWKFSLEDREANVEPEASAPFLRRRLAIRLQAAIERTSFAGRVAERTALRSLIEPALRGEGRVIMIGGAPGVGKTRIAVEFAAEASDRGFLELAGSCYDRDDSVPFSPFVEILEAALAQSRSPEDFRRALSKDAAELARLMPQLRQMFPDIPAPLEVSPEQSRRILFTAIAELLTRTAQNVPVILVIDDLQWADEGTLSLLSYLARSVSKLPVIIVGTFRDNEFDSAGPLAKTLDELIRLHLGERISLLGLPRDGVAEMLRALSGREPADALVSLISSNTEGNPFFVEELFRHLVERGHLTDSNGELRRDLKLVEVDVPQSLRLVIGRHLARLSSGTMAILNFAAVIGRSFTFELLEAATGEDAEQLLDRVEEGERTGLITSTLDRPAARFRFSHELVRQAVLEGLSPPRRQRIHLRVADAIERLHAGALEDHANDLAHHLLQAGSAAADPGRTVRYSAMAAKREISQSAFDSALHHLETALEIVAKLSESHDRTELDLLIDYAATLSTLRGWSEPKLGDVYKRARELCLRVGETQLLLPVLLGLAGFHINRAELKLCRCVVDEMNSVESNSIPDKMVMAGWSMGLAQFFMGEFADAHVSLQQGVRFYDKQRHRGGIAFRMGQDLCASCLIFDAMTLLILGYPDQAERRMQESISLARELGYPFTLTVCLTMMAKYLCIRRDFSRLPDVASETTTLAQEYGFAFYEQGITAYEIIGFGAEGRLEQLNATFERVKRFPPNAHVHYELALSWQRSALAEVVANLGRLNGAARFLNEACEIMKRNDERYVESEICRIQGELTLKQIERNRCTAQELRSAQAQAERTFRAAQEIARRQGAKLFELRAATSLTRLLTSIGRRDEARQILTEIYDSFSEGLEAPDLKVAKAVLQQFNPELRQ